jgi:hypothetical protein
MRKTLRCLAVLGIGAVLLGGLSGFAIAQGPAPGSSPANPPPGYGSGGPDQASNPSAPTDTEPATELPILYVTSVEILRTQTEPQLDIVRVTGLTGSQGWNSPELVPTFVGKPLDGILDLQFIATMPLQTEDATGFAPIGAVFTLEEGHVFKGVRVRASENSIEVDQIPGSKAVKITADGCKDCVGKKFAEKGQAPPGAAGIVREEDLPKVLRWIIPSRGIRGITHDPNRLNLMLGADNTIIAAYWE